MIQTQVINMLLNTQDTSILKVNNIDDSFFSDYYEEFHFIQDHIEKYGNIPDKLTFANRFPQFDWIEVKESNKYLIDALYEDKNKRTLAKTFNRVRELLMSDKVDEAMSLYSNSIEQVKATSHLEAIDLFSDTSRYQAYVDKTQDFSKYYLRTGFTELDEALGGWDRLEELATIVGRPGTGKSFILLRTAIAAAEQGLTVGMYSGEMSALKVGFRMDTLIGHISNRGIMQGDISIQNDYKQFLDTLTEKFKGKFWVITPTDLGHPATVNDLDAFIDKYKLDVLYVDQHSLLEDQRKARDPVTKASNISKDLKNLQVQKRIPIIAASQQNRSSLEEGNALDVSRIAQTDRIGQDSTVVLFLEQKDGVLTIHISKSRDGGGAGMKLKYALDLDHGIFSFIPNEDDALGGSGCEELRNEYEYSTYGEAPF